MSALLQMQRIAAKTGLEDRVREHISVLRMEPNVHMYLTPAHFIWTLSAIFAAGAFVHLAGFRFVREAYARWQYPNGFREVTGTLLALAAIFLSLPVTRFVGLILAAIVMFLSAITLINHRQYGFAAPIVALLFALVPASLVGGPV
jgi:hypothetical protein